MPPYKRCGGRDKRDWGEAVKGDRVEIVVDTGDGARTYEVHATRAGRKPRRGTAKAAFWNLGGRPSHLVWGRVAETLPFGVQNRQNLANQ